MQQQLRIFFPVTKETAVGESAIRMQYGERCNETGTRRRVPCSTSLSRASLQRATDLSGELRISIRRFTPTLFMLFYFITIRESRFDSIRLVGILQSVQGPRPCVKRVMILLYLSFPLILFG